MSVKKKRKSNKIKLVDITKIRFSPEIEVEFPKVKLSERLIERKSLIKGWTIDWDGSLEDGAEYRPNKRNKLYYNEDSLMQIKEILALIKVHRGKVSKRCGLHIHIDCSKFTDKQVHNIICEWIHKQRYIIRKFKVHSDRLDQYCKLLPRENLHKLSIRQIHRFRTEDSWNFNGYSYIDEKYMSLNSTHLAKGDYGTLEFRLFNATLKNKELKNIILWTLNFVKESLERE